MREDWIECSLDEVCQIQTGKFDANHSDPFGKFRFYTCAFEYLKCNTNRFNGESIILPGNGANVGEVFFYNGEFDAYQRTYVINEVLIDSKYLFYHLKCYWKSRNKDKQFGSATNYIRIGNFTSYIADIAPLPIQRAIVSKIEALFSDLDNGIANLKKAQEQLKIYRQAVLKKAFEGKLPALGLDRLKDDRIIDTETKGKGEILKSQNPKNPNSDNLPNGWKWVKLGEVIEKIEAGKSFRCDERPPINEEVGVLKVSAVTWEEFSEHESKTVISDEKINLSYFVQQGDFLFSRANTLELVGRSVIVKRIRKKLMLSDKTLRFIFSELVNPFYILYYLRTYNGRKQIESLSTGNQISMRNIGQSNIKKIIFPLCSLQEQAQIVQEIERRLSVCDKMEQSITESLEKAEALRQSILKKAFEGKLLSEAEIAQCKQAADYEPASELLKKIKAEKLAKEQAKKKK